MMKSKFYISIFLILLFSNYLFADGKISYWKQDNPKYKDYPLHTAPTFAGVSDDVIEEVTSIPQLVKLGLEITTDKEKATALWNSVKNINFSTIKEAATGAIKEKWDKYANSPDYITFHELGKDGVQIASLIYGGFAAKGKKLSEAVEESGNTIKKAIQKKLDDIENFMKTPNFTRLLDDAWSRYKGKLSRADWEAKYKTLYKNREVGKLTEDKFKELMGSDATHLEILTGSGKRYIDNVLDGTAREVKSGNVTWSAYKEQVLKDIEIVKQGLLDKIDRVEWHCFGEIDDSFIKNISDELKKAGLAEIDFKIIKY
jgi:hypothetical protein